MHYSQVTAEHASHLPSSASIRQAQSTNLMLQLQVHIMSLTVNNIWHPSQHLIQYKNFSTFVM